MPEDVYGRPEPVRAAHTDGGGTRNETDSLMQRFSTIQQQEQREEYGEGVRFSTFLDKFHIREKIAATSGRPITEVIETTKTELRDKEASDGWNPFVSNGHVAQREIQHRNSALSPIEVRIQALKAEAERLKTGHYQISSSREAIKAVAYTLEAEAALLSTQTKQ